VRALNTALLALVLMGDRPVSVSGSIRDGVHPVPEARVRIALPDAETWVLDLVTDSTGRFRGAVPAQPGCFRLQARSIGYGITERTFELGPDSIADLGLIPIRGAPVPEWPVLLVLECQRPDAGRYDGALGVDTVLLSP
jgi:hypothetical protein